MGVSNVQTGVIPIRLLFIGNSYTYCNDMPSIFAAMSDGSTNHILFETRAVAFGGATLQEHWESGEALQALKDGVWDYVVLQEQSTLPIQRPEQMHQYVRLFNREIGQLGAKTVLYLTWSRRDAPETQDRLTHAYRAIAEEIGAVVVPVGPAWQKVNQEEFALYEDDGSHPTFVGSYLAACVFYSVLMGMPPERIAAEFQGEISAELAENLHCTAWEVMSA